jgi:hypothetical protein
MQYLLFDAALNGTYTLLHLQQAYPVHQSLFKDTPDSSLADVAPYLFEIDDQFYTKLKDIPELSLEGLIRIDWVPNMDTLANHLRTHIYQKVKGREYYFRFWDGRVLRKFLPSCEEVQLRLFFGNIRNFTMQDEDPGYDVKFSLEKYRLVKSQVVSSKS